MKVTTPLALEGPLAAEMMELPPLGLNVTVSPATGVSVASSNVTVIVDVVPSAVTVVGLAVTVEWPASVVAPNADGVPIANDATIVVKKSAVVANVIRRVRVTCICVLPLRAGFPPLRSKHGCR